MISPATTGTGQTLSYGQSRVLTTLPADGMICDDGKHIRFQVMPQIEYPYITLSSWMCYGIVNVPKPLVFRLCLELKL